MQSTRAEKILAIAVPTVGLAWYLSPVGGGWLAPLTRTGGSQLVFAILIFAFAGVLSSGYLRQSKRIGYAALILVPPIAMLIAGGLCVLVANAIAPFGFNRLTNSISEYGWMSLVRNIFSLGVLSGAWLLGIALSFFATWIKIVKQKASVRHSTAPTR